MKKKLLSFLTAAAMFLTSIPFMAVPAAAITSYKLWIGGVRVTSYNASAITGDTITGEVSYDADTKTLTLNGASITAAVVGGNNEAYGIRTELSELKIELIGNNTILPMSVAGNHAYGIYGESINNEDGNNTIEFTGTGSLNVTAGEATLSTSYGIFGGKLIISEGTITANGGKSSMFSDGICVRELEVSGGTLNANGGTSNGISAGLLILTDSAQISGNATVNATGGAANNSYGISGNLSISDTAWVYATGGEGTNTSYGYTNGTLSMAGGRFIAKTTATGAATVRALNTAISVEEFRAYGSLSSDGNNLADYVAANNDTYKYVSVFPKQYDVIVGETTVNYYNKGDVLGDGTVSYEPSTNTLTLNGANITTHNVNGSLCGIYTGGDNAATIKLIGENTINGSGDSHPSIFGIRSSENLTITGTGSLEINVENTESGEVQNNPMAYGISCYNSILTVESGTITSNATSIHPLSSGYGIKGDTISISGGTVTASGKGGNYSYGIKGDTITISGGTVTATGKYSQSGSYGLSTNALTVNGTADLTAKSEGAVVYSCGAKTQTMTVNGAPKIALINEGSAENYCAPCGLEITDGGSLQVNGISQMTIKGAYKALYVPSNMNISITFAEGIKVLGGETLEAAPTAAYVDANRSNYKWITATGSCKITASAGAGGTISPSGEVSVNSGESKTFTITPASNYKIASVTVDGVNVGTAATYTFDNVGENHTISAEFTANGGSYNVTIIPDEEKKTDWTEVGKQLEAAQDGDTVTVDMNGGTSIPAETLEAIKGKDIDLVLDMGDGMTWTINGKDIANAQNVDLGMKKDTTTIPVEVTNKITGETKMLQLSFEFDGELGFTATLTIELGDDVDGLFANLMLFNPETKTLEFVASAKISGGKASLPFSHFSDWAIYIDSVDYAAGVPGADAEQGTTAGEETDKPGNPNTGVSALPTAALTAISAAVIIVSKKRKQK